MSEEWRRRFLDVLDEYLAIAISDWTTQARLDRSQQLRTQLFHMLGDVQPNGVQKATTDE